MIAALAVAAVCVIAVDADDSSSENTVYWEEGDLAYSAVEGSGEAEVSCVSVDTTGDIVIPGTSDHDGVTYTVTKIADYGFAYCWHIDSVIIPETVTEIGKLAFAGMTYEDPNYSGDDSASDGVTSISFAGTSHVKTIGDGAFKSTATAFTDQLTIPASVETIGDYAFAYMSTQYSEYVRSYGGPSSLVFEAAADGSSGLRSIGAYAFAGNAYLGGNLTIPASVTSIGDHAFAGCGELYSGAEDGAAIAFAGAGGTSQLASIGDDAFSGWALGSDPSADAVTIPASVQNIGEGAFSDTGMDFAFAGTDDGTSQLASIGDDAFSGTGCASLEIPGSVSDMGSSFKDCTSLTDVTFRAKEGSLALETMDGTFGGCTSLRSVTFEADPSALSLSGTFSGCTSLASVVLPEGVKAIGDSAFNDCTLLASVTIPASAESIGDSAFNGCTVLATVTIPDGSGLSAIGASAFYNCSALATIDLPGSLTTLGEEAFCRCTSLPSADIGGVGVIAESAFDGCTSLESADISSARSIGQRAFAGCSALTSVSLPEGLETISKAAFSGTGLESVTIPSSVTSIGEGAFQACTALTSAVMLSSNITELSGDLFYGCSRLSGFVVPDSVMDLGDDAIKFDRMAESDAEGHTVRIVSGTSSNGHAYKVLYNGDRLLRFSFVDSDGNEDDITDGKLSESDFATILNGVTGVGKYAFNSVNCIYAHYGSEFTLNIPSTVTYIGMSAFSFHK